jgi:hypothetical protein
MVSSTCLLYSENKCNTRAETAGSYSATSIVSNGLVFSEYNTGLAVGLMDPTLF